MFPLAGDDLLTLQKALDVLEQTIQAGTPLLTVAKQCLESCREHSQARYALAIVGDRKKELVQEIAAARTGMEKAFATGKDWDS